MIFWKLLWETFPFDEEDEEPEVRQREDGSFLMDGALSLEDFKHALDVEDLDEYEEDNYQTLAGLVMAHMGKIPEAGDNFEWKNLRFEVLDMDGNRIDKVLVNARMRKPRNLKGLLDYQLLDEPPPPKLPPPKLLPDEPLPLDHPPPDQLTATPPSFCVGT